jgi:hypothetical protein
MADKRVDEKAHPHPCSTCHHSFATTDVFHNPQAYDGSGDVDGTKDDRGDVRVFESGRSEDGSAVVELNGQQ